MSQSSSEVSPPGGESTLVRCVLALFRGAHYCGAAFIAAMAALAFVHSMGRYVFDRPVPGAVELAQLGLILAVFLTGAYTMAAKGHIDIPLLVDRFSERTQAIIGVVIQLLSVAFAFLVAWQSFVRGTIVMEGGTTTPVLLIPHFPFIYILGFGWALFGVAILMDLIHSIRSAVKR